MHPATPGHHWIHDLDPIALQLGPLALRWYGLAYVAGFVAVILLLKWFARLGVSRLPGEKAVDFVTLAAVFGVMLGGRIGYFLFGYGDPGELARDPLLLFRLWEGGMASHGGILGLMVFLLWYARRHGLGWRHLGDNLVVGAPVGLLLGRIANFINGELYGRAAPALNWAVKFPGEIMPNPAHPGLALPPGTRAMAERAALAVDPTLAEAGSFYGELIARMRENQALQEAVGAFLTPRHPSQLYEAALEGLALFALLLAVRLRFRKLADGVLTGLFFIGYAVFRIAAEQFREPDSTLIGPLSKGQFYSLFMIAIGVAFLATAGRPRPRPAA
jgi:phosphatidylglycerol---prolipoprotein diacylglyceryl transferase